MSKKEPLPTGKGYSLLLLEYRYGEIKQPVDQEARLPDAEFINLAQKRVGLKPLIGLPFFDDCPNVEIWA